MAVFEEMPFEQVVSDAMALVNGEADPVSLGLADSGSHVTGKWSPSSEGATGRLSPAIPGQVLRLEEAGDDPVWFATAQSSAPQLELLDPFDPKPYELTSVAGASTVSAQAAAETARWEALERFALGDVVPEALIFEAARDLAGPWLHPHELVSYGEDQRVRHGLTLFDPDVSEWWVRGRAARKHGRQVWVPAALVFSPFPVPHWLHPGAQNTNGVAVHVSVADATMAAWLEAVERNAVLLVWARKHPPPFVDEVNLSATAASLLRTIRRCAGVDAAALVSLPGEVATIAAIALGGGVGVCIGAAAGDPGRSAVKALTECLAQVRFPFLPTGRAEDVRTPAQHGGFYIVDNRRADADWLLDSEERVSLRDLPERPSRPLGRVVRIPLPSKLVGAAVAVKVVCPGLVPLTFGYDAEPIGLTPLRAAYMAGSQDLHHPLIPHPFA